MFKKKTDTKPLEEEELIEEIPIEEEEEEVEEIEDEVVEEEEIPAPKKTAKKSTKKSTYSPGDIIPVQQTVGYQVVKSVAEDGSPMVIPTDKLSEAEILSFMYMEE